MKTRALAIGLVSLAMLLASPQAASAQSNSSCAVVSISIVTGTATVAPGTTVGIGGGIKNCSPRKARYTLVVSAMSSCGQKTEIASSRLSFNPDENKIWSISYPMPANTCGGTWEASVQVRDGRDNGGSPSSALDAPLASASTTLMVQ
jgi:hypothetical protein